MMKPAFLPLSPLPILMASKTAIWLQAEFGQLLAQP